MKTIKVQNMTSNNGNKVPNQFIVKSENGTYFQSYNSLIAFEDENGNITLDEYYWNYSKTTSKYRNAFTGLTTEETKAKIKSGEIKISNLN